VLHVSIEHTRFHAVSAMCCYTRIFHANFLITQIFSSDQSDYQTNICEHLWKSYKTFQQHNNTSLSYLKEHFVVRKQTCQLAAVNMANVNSDNDSVYSVTVRGIFVMERTGLPFWKFVLRTTQARTAFRNLFFIALM
jgi:hypothetical protein